MGCMASHTSQLIYLVYSNVTGLPLVLCAIGAGISLEDYNGADWCVVGGIPFYTTVLAPVALIIIFNTICLVAITYTLIFQTDSIANSKPMELRVRFRIVFGFIVLFGITWVFGLLVVSNDYVVFQYVFCVFSCCKGFYVFLFYGVRVKVNRWAWCQLFRCQNMKEIQRNHTKKSQMINTNDVSSPLCLNSDSNASSSLLKLVGKKSTSL